MSNKAFRIALLWLVFGLVVPLSLVLLTAKSVEAVWEILSPILMAVFLAIFLPIRLRKKKTA